MKVQWRILRVGVQEYESALAVIEAGSRKAATFLTDKGWDRFVSPMIHNLQILQSGKDTSMVHRRASVKRYEHADPVYFCFCNMAQFKQYKLGFDRMFHVGEVKDDAARVQEAALRRNRRRLPQSVQACWRKTWLPPRTLSMRSADMRQATERGVLLVWPIWRRQNSKLVI